MESLRCSTIIVLLNPEAQRPSIATPHQTQGEGKKIFSMAKKMFLRRNLWISGSWIAINTKQPSKEMVSYTLGDLWKNIQSNIGFLQEVLKICCILGEGHI